MDSTLQSLARFEFPELPVLGEESPTPDAPMAVWPEADRPETVRACNELARDIRRWLCSEGQLILAFTSPGDGDGKTSLVVHLAPALAQFGQAVLVIDADFRQSDLTSWLAVRPGGEPLGSGLIYPTNLPGLNVLPMSPQQSSSIEEIAEGWPLVLIDMGSLEQADAVAMLRYCDGVCLVVRLGHTTRQAVAKAPRLIRHYGGRLLGSVVLE